MNTAPVAFQYASNVSSPAFCGKEKSVLNSANRVVKMAKTQLALADLSPLAAYNRYKVLFSDPEAFVHGLFERKNDILKSKSLLGKVNLPYRDKKGSSGANIIKFVFEDGTDRFSIKRLGETLSYVDTKLQDDNNIVVYYLCNIAGRKRFRGLEKMTLQAVVEDAVNKKQKIPSLSAVPAQIGNLNFDRLSLYKMMGAEERPYYTFLGRNLCTEVYCSPETVLEKLKKIARKDGFLFSETKANFEKILAQSGG